MLCSTALRRIPIEVDRRVILNRGKVILISKFHSESGSEPGYLHDSLWPNNNNPTPYEIFNLKGTDVDNKSLKKIYHKYVKLYHPDMSCNKHILRNVSGKESRLLSIEEKLERFKLISHAYEILKDKDKKFLYDCNKSGWVNNGCVRHNYPNAYSTKHYGNGYGYQSDYTYAYWSAGTWDDVQELNREKESFNIWQLCIFVCSLYACVKGVALLSELEDAINMKSPSQEDSERDLILSYTNYGLDTDKMSRLKRFLWFRTFSMFRTKEDLDREVAKNNKLLAELEKPKKQK
ncbi:hypothetical protein Kpol_376p12 [Vanderwaltozyma polyspora DSM 70294]|uniref:J domain-containing protein n=1 Tax=Vanderwaltozyma polyspora (strain ATCC 22028 / DSM 70294 / BCRC 21397 / CBS 2163 / NBRC 10782 / NRRL Y-8283 / UCD 57-17) TaxID=436907 RepID=A7TRW2_VANPO|nr:uncharacterized protein Kpol_376p12 [Vanderwaltozyma polyspora DSM 70294]EDO14999.1 hypothetical protein Kpol_376p12 [Vanderwaltozyma polyspora DSM 70294]